MMAAVATRLRQEPYHIPSRPVQQQACSSLSVRPAREKQRSANSTLSKLDKCKTQAQQRRLIQKGLMEELAGLLPFPKEVTSQMDTKTVLRLAICYLRVKSLMSDKGATDSPTAESASAEWPANFESSYQTQSVATWNPAMLWNGMGTGKEDIFGLGILQDLIIEALDGFLMVVSCEGTLLYISDTVYTHTGLFQSEHIGKSVYSLIHEEDHSDVREALAEAEGAALSSGVAQCSFFCRMKSKKKNTHLKAPGYKLVYVTGHCKVHMSETCLACTVHIVSAPSILEIRMEGNAFTTRHNMEMKIIFYDERLQDVLGYTKKDLLGQTIFALHHHDDVAVTESCSHKVREKGEAVTGYYRFMTNYGTYVWLQSRATMIVDRRTGKPSQLLCMHFIVEKSKGEHSLTLRNMLANKSTQPRSISMDPVPIPRPDGERVNPLAQTEDSTQLPVLPPPPQSTQLPILPPPSSVTPLSVPMTTDHFTSSLGTSYTTTANALHLSPASGAVSDVEQSSLPPCGVTRGVTMTTTEQCVTGQLELDGDVIQQAEAGMGDWLDSFELLSSSCDSRGDTPLINLPPSTSFPHSHSLIPSPPMVTSGRNQPYPLFSLSSSPSSSPSPAASINQDVRNGGASSLYSTPVVSPYWHDETTSHSMLGSNITSPQSIPSHAHTPEPATLDSILQDLLGTTSEQTASAANYETVSISPDSGCTELENYLASITSGSPQSSLPYTPARSPACTPARSPACTPARSPAGCCMAPSPLGYTASVSLPWCDSTHTSPVSASPIKKSGTLRGLLTVPPSVQEHILSQ